ncbi:MAG: 3-hydroxyacyl-CoA dehydrogenase NAD-binding domain-containing protein [Candidatus Omnitrophota bacterium]
MENQLQKVNILGFGIMGRQIAALLVFAGYDVNIWSRNIDENNKALYHREIKKIEKFLIQDPQENGTITYTSNIKALLPALTFEVLCEDVEVKKKVICLLDYDLQNHGILTNTSSYAPEEIHPSAVGIHFFNPIYLLKFAELSCASIDLPLGVKFLIDFLRERLNFEIITVNGNRGYIGNYLLFQEIANALKLVDRYGYDTRRIDQVLSHMGRSVSIFDIIDLVGVDVTRRIILNLKENDSAIFYSPIFDKALSDNVLGKKNKTSIRSVVDDVRWGKGGV